MPRILIVLSGLCLALVACQREAAAEPPAAAPTTNTAPAAAAETPPPTTQNYTVRIVPGEAKAGAQATSVIEVTPAKGYKMNLEFPSRLSLEPTAGVKPAKEQLGKDDAEVTEKALRFKVAFTPASAGKLSMAGSADFSVCNDSTCKLIRDEKLAWVVNVK